MAIPPKMTRLEYENKRSWLIDTAETPKDKANLKKELAALKKIYKASRRAGGITDRNAKAHVQEMYRNMGN